MTAAAGSTHSLRARRFRTQYLVARGHPAPDALRARLDESVRRDLAGALSPVLESRLPAGDRSVWHIRRLDVDLTVDASWSPEDLARAIAGRLVGSLESVMASGGDGVNAIRFSTPSEQLARFITDLLNDVAWSRWYNSGFEGLRVLPKSEGLRTALVANPDEGFSVLRALPQKELSRLIAQLSSLDARRVLGAIPDAGGGKDLAGAVLALLPVLIDSEAGESSRPDERLVLRLVVECCRADPRRFGPGLVTAAGMLVCVWREAASFSPVQRQLLAAALTAGAVTDLRRVLPASEITPLLPVIELPAAVRREIARAIQTQKVSRATKKSEPESRVSTPFGGAFFLLPILGTLPLEEATAGWPSCAGTRPADLLRFLLLVLCAGAVAPRGAFADPLLRDIMRVSPHTSSDAVTEWLGLLSPAKVALLQETVARWRWSLPAAERSLHLVRVRVASRLRTLLVEGPKGTWLYSAPASAHSERGMLGQVVRDLQLKGAGPAEPLVQEPGTPIWGQRERIERDFYGLALVGDLRPSRPVELMLAILAQGVLRDFSARLPGFAHASVSHLQSNFLDVVATVEEEGNRRVVRLSRAPLQIILGLTGLPSARFHLPWLGGKPFALFPQESQ